VGGLLGRAAQQHGAPRRRGAPPHTHAHTPRAGATHAAPLPGLALEPAPPTGPRRDVHRRRAATSCRRACPPTPLRQPPRPRRTLQLLLCLLAAAPAPIGRCRPLPAALSRARAPGARRRLPRRRQPAPSHVRPGLGGDGGGPGQAAAAGEAAGGGQEEVRGAEGGCGGQGRRRRAPPVRLLRQRGARPFRRRRRRRRRRVSYQRLRLRCRSGAARRSPLSFRRSSPPRPPPTSPLPPTHPLRPTSPPARGRCWTRA